MMPYRILGVFLDSVSQREKNEMMPKNWTGWKSLSLAEIDFWIYSIAKAWSYKGHLKLFFFCNESRRTYRFCFKSNYFWVFCLNSPFLKSQIQSRFSVGMLISRSSIIEFLKKWHCLKQTGGKQGIKFQRSYEVINRMASTFCTVRVRINFYYYFSLFTDSIGQAF